MSQRCLQPCLACVYERLGARGGSNGSHDDDPQVATRSSATPKGEEATPLGSLRSALRMTVRGTPCCKARLQTTAESLAAESLSEPTFELLINISARSPFG